MRERAVMHSSRHRTFFPHFRPHAAAGLHRRFRASGWLV